MTAIGLAHYGGTMGLYNEPEEEWSRALAYFDHMDDMSAADALRRERIARQRAG